LNGKINQEGEKSMATRKIEIFSAGCPVCEETIQRVKNNSCPSCEVTVLDMKEAGVAGRAKDLGIRSVPAVVIDGRVADCCSGRGPDVDTLKTLGLGQPISQGN
jgi:glutaredoxin